ncbi:MULTISPECIES: LpqN/LpqT family lipoprotein [unclassified Mycobacterium]|uniref:LpqN/LpqT family lipoprotein n=1 Tax=unclassified Mycobacterium TaxID=2642494 RepID=UPI0009ED4B42|nr:MULTISPECIES: LpqN/LpqT family lipoprotein [unclassified Mycobacterium]
MRFDEFTGTHCLDVFPVDRFAGFVVEVGVPRGWDPLSAATGVRLWACRNDPRIKTFCANAVLTMHHVQAALDPAEVFTMLAEQQVQSVPNSSELSREISAAAEGTGAAGMLTMQIAHELGTIESVSRSRIVNGERGTLIAQLTVTALENSPVDRASIWLKVRPGPSVSSTPAGHPSVSPVTATRAGQ